MLPLKPIYLFADSQLLFWQPGGAPFLMSVRGLIEAESPSAAYVGASNDDDPTYYGLFASAMEKVGIENCRMISSNLSQSEASFVEQADLILLAGGDAEKGWRVFERNGLQDLIPRRYSEGAVLMGISAGAAQLGMLGRPETVDGSEGLFRTFGLVPFVISAHDERNDWRALKRMLKAAEVKVPGIGIPSGGGMVYHADHSVQPIRHALHEFSVVEGQTNHTLLFPNDGGLVIEAQEVC